MRKTIVATGGALLLVALFAIIVFSTQISMAPFVRIGMQAVMAMQGQDILFDSEYPPLASSLFYLLQINPLTSFNVGWKLLLMLVLSVATVIGMRMERRNGWMLPLATILTILLLGPELTLARYDLLVAFLLFIVWRAPKQEGDAVSGVSLGLAASLKIVPLLLLPFLWIRAARRTWFSVGLILGLALGLVASIVILGFDLTFQNIRYLFAYHGTREIHLESLWAGILLFAAAFTGQTMTIDNQHRAFELVGYSWLASAAIGLTLLGLAWLFFRNVRDPSRRSDDESFFLPLLWAFLVTPVLSPQFLVWVVPLLLIEAWEELQERRSMPRFALLLSLTVVVSLLTRLIFPVYYDALVRLSFPAIVLLNLRNLCILGLVVVLWRSPRGNQKGPQMA